MQRYAGEHAPLCWRTCNITPIPHFLFSAHSHPSSTAAACSPRAHPTRTRGRRRRAAPRDCEYLGPIAPALFGISYPVPPRLRLVCSSLAPLANAIAQPFRFSVLPRRIRGNDEDTTSKQATNAQHSGTRRCKSAGTADAHTLPRLACPLARPRRHTYCAASTLLTKEWASCCKMESPAGQARKISSPMSKGAGIKRPARGAAAQAQCRVTGGGGKRRC